MGESYSLCRKAQKLKGFNRWQQGWALGPGCHGELKVCQAAPAKRVATGVFVPRLPSENQALFRVGNLLERIGFGIDCEVVMALNSHPRYEEN